MSYSSFYDWVRNNRFFAIPLIILFIFGTIFQTTDTITRVKGWFETETVNVLHIESSLDGFEPENAIINRASGDEEVSLSIDLKTRAETNADFLQNFLNNSDEVWLVRVEGVDVIVEMSEEGTQFTMPVGLQLDTPFVIGVEAKEKDGTAVQISLYFPNIDADKPWADFESVPVTCCYGTYKHTAFYRFIEFQDKGQPPFLRQFKAQYVEPETELAKSLLAELNTENHKQLYFELKPEPSNN